MQKNSITNKITPCCGLPFSVIYWWVSNLTLNSESDRQYLLTQISQSGVLSIDGWKVLINSGTLEADASLTKAEFLAWFDCGKQPTCEQLKLIIEGYKISNWDYFKNSVEELNEAWQELENKLKLKYNDVSDSEAIDIIQRVDQFTGESVNYRETTTWYDGSTMDDSKVDGVIYIKRNNKFYKRAGFNGQEINILHLGAKSEPNFDNTAILQIAVDNYKNVFIPEGVFEFTRFKITKEGVRLYGLGAGISVLSSTNVFQSGVHVPPNIRILNHNCTIEGITSTFTNVPDWKITAVGQSPINSDANLSIGWSEAYAPSNSFLIENATIKNCEVIGSFVQGIAIGVSENARILNNKVSQIRGTAIFGYYASKITVEGNEVWFTGDDGIYMAGNGASIYSPHAMNENVVIQNNYVHDVGTKGIGISGCSSAVIKNNLIDYTWVDGIMAEQDGAGGHVTPKNVKILNNVLTNLFGAFGGDYKHSQNANATTGGAYGGIKTFNKDNDSSVYEISGNYIELSENVLSTGGLYNAIILGFNTNFINNTLLKNGKINMWVGQMFGQTGSENILIKGNNIKSNYRNILLVRTKKTKIVNNNFYAPDWGILTDQTENVKVIANTGHINTIFFLNQTNDAGVVLADNYFDINN